MRGAARMSYSADGPGKTASTPATTATAMMALISRSRSSTRWATKGCSVPASSSSWSWGDVDIGEGPPALPAPLSVELLRAVLCHTGGAGQRARAHPGARLVPVRHCALLHAPLLFRVLVFGERRCLRQR